MTECPDTPMLDKERAARAAHSRDIGDFLEWLLHERGLVIAAHGEYDRLWPVALRHGTVRGLLAEYFDIDLDQSNVERQALVDALPCGREP